MSPEDSCWSSIRLRIRQAAKLRPVLVVSGAKFNNGEDIVVVPLSSQVDPRDQFGYPIMATDPYFPETKLRKDSTIKWTKLMTINRQVVEKELGTVPPPVLAKVQELIKSLLC